VAQRALEKHQQRVAQCIHAFLKPSHKEWRRAFMGVAASSSQMYVFGGYVTETKGKYYGILNFELNVQVQGN
jgi:hypothetical protein